MDGEQKDPDRNEPPAPVVGSGGFQHVKKDGTPGNRNLKLIGPGGHFWRLKHWLNERLTKKQMIIGGVAFVLVFGGVVAFALSNRAGAPKPAAVASQPPKPVITSPLTGLPVTAAQAKRPVTGVMIENTDFARPQSGLGSAGVVFEAIAEAGITRFLALYQEAAPGNVGPIRSVRPYYLQWNMGFDASIAHVGGSPQALSDITNWGARDIGEFTYGGYYHRISTRVAPHNVYTSMASLNAIEKLKHWTKSTFTGFARKPDSPSKTPNATSINFNISSSDFNVHYAYDTKRNAYLRWEGGAKHTDANTHKQLEPKVVVGMVVPFSLGPLDTTGAYYSDYGAIGSGRAYVFQDGTLTVGKWYKASKTDPLKFLTTSGSPLKLNAGQTWITALANTGEITYHGPAKPKQ
jgi:DUF3048 family protein